MYSVLPIFLEFEEIPRIIVKSEEFLRKGGAVNIFLNIFPRILPEPVGNTENANHTALWSVFPIFLEFEEIPRIPE